MQLSAYLTENKITLAEFAEQIGRSEATVSRIARGLHRPDWSTMLAIEKATEGKVLSGDFREMATPSPDPAPAAPAQPQERVA